MNKMQKVISALVVLFGLLSVVIAIFAEIKQAVANSNVTNDKDGYCVHWEQKPKLAQIGALAIIMLILAQIIINVAGGFICSAALGKNNNWAVPLGFLVLCWVFFVIASNLYVAGIALNGHEEYYCYGVTPGMFAGGAFSTLLAVASGVLFYIKISALNSEDTTVNFAL